MARRFSAPYQSEPVSSLASWARNLAVFSVVAVLVSIIIVRQGFLEMHRRWRPSSARWLRRSFDLVGLAAFVAIWQNGSRGMSRILLALLIDAVVLAYPAYLALQYRKLPPIHDITTNPIDPPRFDALARLAHRRRHQHRGLCRTVFRRTAAAGLSRCRDGGTRRPRTAGPLRSRCKLVNKRKWVVIDERPRSAAPHRPHRSGGADADHGIPRGCLDPRHARWRGIARRYPLLVPLFRERSRQQRRAHPPA